MTWDPYVASAQRQQNARVLADGQGLASYQRYYLASTEYAKAHPEVLKQVFAELQKTGRWVKEHPTDAAKVLGPLWGNLDVATVEQANARRSYDVQPVRKDGLDEQQRIADAFYAEGLLPKPSTPVRCRYGNRTWQATDPPFPPLRRSGPVTARLAAFVRISRSST